MTLWAAAELIRSSKAGRRAMTGLCDLLSVAIDAASLHGVNAGLQAAACSAISELLASPWGHQVAREAQTRAGEFAMESIANHKKSATVLKQALAVLASLASVSSDFLANPEVKDPLVGALESAMEMFKDKPEIQAVSEGGRRKANVEASQKRTCSNAGLADVVNRVTGRLGCPHARRARCHAPRTYALPAGRGDRGCRAGAEREGGALQHHPGHGGGGRPRRPPVRHGGALPAVPRGAGGGVHGARRDSARDDGRRGDRGG